MDPARIVLGGESAGSTHATAATLALRDAGGPLPRALWVMAPALDAAGSGESRRLFAEGAGRSAAEIQPGFSGGTAGAFPNNDTSQAPVIAMLKMEPGAVLAKHHHPKAIEAVFVLDGEMINAGTPPEAGTFVPHGPGVTHGPHTTKTGCTLMFIKYPGVGPDDSVFV